MNLMEKAAVKLFGKKEILSIEKFYPFIEKKKIITFVPGNAVDKLTATMSKAGAGVIGNYRMCSFRTEGTGTFLPTAKANPFSGTRKKFSFEKEIKLEMECDAGELNKALDALHENHPYEEIAYEIYGFIKRDKKQSGIVVVLKKEISFLQFLKKVNKKISAGEMDSKQRIRKIALIKDNLTDSIFNSAKLLNCNCILEAFGNNLKLHII